MPDLVQLTRDGDIAIITVVNPPVNALSPGVPEGIELCLAEAVADPGVRACVLIGSGRTFIAGADIREFVKITRGERGKELLLEEILEKIENAPKAVVAALHGTALGGGLETAMACHYRVAVGSAQMGQPEVKLGLIPGAGGTQRLPRLIGPAKAAELCAVGDPIGAKAALELGLIDQIVEGDLLAGAVAFARSVAGPRRTRDLDAKLTPFARPKLGDKQRGRMAPVRAIEAVELSMMLPFEDAIREERRIFEQLLFSDESKSLVHVFLGEREVAKVPGVAEVKDPGIAQAAIIGAGTMGGGIAMTYANAGIPVLLKETTQEALERGMATIRKNYASTVAKGRLSQEDADKRVARITPTLAWDGFEKADIVVEAVFENLELKKEIFREIDRVAKDSAVLATNTSTLSIDEIASVTKRPHRVIGNHFFSPANVMRLLEIVRGRDTAPDVIGTCLALGKKLGKVAVVVGNCYGFVGNRMFHPYRYESQFLVEEGASYEEVDQVLYDFGMAMGPFAVGDLAGLDVGWRIRKEFAHLVKPGERQPLVEDHLCAMGRYGQKTGAGWYRYDERRNRSVDPEVTAMVERLAGEAGIQRRKVSREEILDRCLYSLVNEGCRILEEGIALRPVDIDIVYINGYGFPAHKGGPMKYAESVGWKKVYERVREFEAAHGGWWAPAPLLKKFASVE
ncbi:MAG: 3-hydroxyacyl-CoA dehydrogenase NAD-binding domain-containing protein [Bryobacteraceae bacterium]